MKAGIVGCGFVGSSGAYAMALKGTVSEIVLVDLNKKLAQGQPRISSTRLPFPIRCVSWLVTIRFSRTPGCRSRLRVGQRPGETRLQLLERNVEVFKRLFHRSFSLRRRLCSWLFPTRWM